MYLKSKNLISIYVLQKNVSFYLQKEKKNHRPFNLGRVQPNTCKYKQGGQLKKKKTHTEQYKYVKYITEF